MTRRRLALIVAATMATVGASFVPSSAASAAPVAVTGFSHCLAGCTAYAGGQISWYNRTVSVAASVDDWTPEQWVWTYAEFAAFAGDTKISQKGIWATNGTSRETFPLGDTNRAGGVNRIRIILCRDSGPHIQPHQNGFFRECGPHANVLRPW